MGAFFIMCYEFYVLFGSKHNVVDNGDVGSGYEAVAVNITGVDMGCIAFEQVVVNGCDIGGVYCSVTIHVTYYHSCWVEAELLVHPCQAVVNPFLEVVDLVVIVLSYVLVGPHILSPSRPSLAVAVHSALRGELSCH